MDTAQVINKARKDFNNAVAVMSIIPVLGFVYLIVGKISSLSVLEGEVSYAVFILLILVLLGIANGRKILWYMITRVINMQKELIEKERLASISETVLSLSHEIRNPLAIIMGNLDLITGEAAEGKTLALSWDQAHTIKANCNRIVVVMDKMSRISKPSFITLGDNIKMLDLPACELNT